MKLRKIESCPVSELLYGLPMGVGRNTGSHRAIKILTETLRRISEKS